MASWSWRPRTSACSLLLRCRTEWYCGHLGFGLGHGVPKGQYLRLLRTSMGTCTAPSLWRDQWIRVIPCPNPDRDLIEGDAWSCLHRSGGGIIMGKCASSGCHRGRVALYDRSLRGKLVMYRSYASVAPRWVLVMVLRIRSWSRASSNVLCLATI